MEDTGSYVMEEFSIEQDGHTMKVFEFYDGAVEQSRFETLNHSQDIQWRYKAGLMVALGMVHVLPTLNSSHAFIVSDEDRLESIVGFYPPLDEESHNKILETFGSHTSNETVN